MKTRTLTATALAVGLLSSIHEASSAAAPSTPAFAPPKPPSVASAGGRAPAFKIKNAAPESFLGQVELGKKVVKSTPSGPPPINASFTQQPEGVTVDLFSPWWVHFANNQAPADVSFHANTVPTFDANKGHAGVQFRATAGNLYVVECPITGGPTAMYRQTIHPAGGAPPVIESKGAGPVAYLATANVVIDVDVQGHLLDGEDYSWNFKGCRITTFSYQ